MLRKPTSVWHYVAGLIIAFAFPVSIPLALSLLITFCWLEYHQGKKIGDTWILDCLECLRGAFIGGAVLIVLDFLSI